MTDKTMVQVPGDSPLMLAWNEYKRGPDYANIKNWATKPEHTDGSLWAAFSAGFNTTQPESSRYGHHGDQIRALQPSVAVTEAMVDRFIEAFTDTMLFPEYRANVRTALVAALAQGGKP